MAVLVTIVGVVGLLVGLMVYGTLVGTFVLSTLWGWFITPLFGTPVPPFPMVAGLLLVTHYMTSHTSSHYKDHESDLVPELAGGLTAPWLVLFAGWVIHLWAGS